MLAAIDHIFNARRVALVGLSSDARKMTGAPLAILKQTGFAGEIWPVNPRHAEIGGLQCYASVADLPGTPDVALIMLPASACAQAVRDCAAKGIPACVIPSAGFEESEDGAQHAADLRAAAQDCGVAVVGPNCEGLWSVRSRVLLTFGSAARRDVLHHAPIAILSQSGAMAGAMARHLQDDGLGCAYMVSVGNEAVLTIADYLAWMIEQDDVQVVALFIEGLRDGERLLRLIEAARARGIRVVALKSGNTAAGIQAAASHTGKMASDFEVYRDLLAAAGAIMVESLTELISACEVLAVAPEPPVKGGSGGVSVFSIPGGTRAMTVDHLDRHDVPLATFDRHTVQALTDALPEFGGVENPTDLTGQVLSHPGLFDRCLDIIARDPATEALIVQVANRGPRDIMERVDLLSRVATDTHLPVIATFLGDSLPQPQRATLRAAGVLCARDPAEAARYLGWLYASRQSSAKAVGQHETTRPLALDRGWAAVDAWLHEAGVPAPAWRILAPDELAATQCGALRLPVAVKALPEDAEHKTEGGLLSLNVASMAAIDQEAARIRAAMGRPDVGILVQEMAPVGVEVIMAALENPDFGPVLALGLGGIATELFHDIAWVALPASDEAVRHALRRTRLSTVLAGFRGRPAADLEALVSTVQRFGRAFLNTVPRPREAEINPLIVLPVGQGVLGVDVLVTR